MGAGNVKLSYFATGEDGVTHNCCDMNTASFNALATSCGSFNRLLHDVLSSSRHGAAVAHVFQSSKPLGSL